MACEVTGDFALPGREAGFVDLSDWRQKLYDFRRHEPENLQTAEVSHGKIRRTLNREL